MRVIGITGRIGSGKSTLCAILARRHGCEVIDADALGHEALRCGGALREALLSRFGPAILDAGGAIDRGRLGRIVFADREALADLNAIVHPWIVERILDLLARLRRGGSVGMVLLDAALLLDWSDRLRCERIVLVRSTDETAIERLRLRGLSEEEARQRLEQQATDHELEGRVDLIIENSGSLEELEREAARLWDSLKLGEEEGSR